MNIYLFIYSRLQPAERLSIMVMQLGPHETEGLRGVLNWTPLIRQKNDPPGGDENIPVVENNSNQTCSCPGAWRVSPTMCAQLRSPPETPRISEHSIVYRSLRGARNWAPILARDAIVARTGH